MRDNADHGEPERHRMYNNTLSSSDMSDMITSRRTRKNGVSSNATTANETAAKNMNLAEATSVNKPSRATTRIINPTKKETNK